MLTEVETKKTITFREDSITFVFEQATLKYDIDNEVTTEETERGISWQNDAKRWQLCQNYILIFNILVNTATLYLGASKSILTLKIIFFKKKEEALAGITHVNSLFSVQVKIQLLL